MRKVNAQLIKKYNIDLLGFDFMGYPFESANLELDLHHLLIPHCYSSEMHFGQGYQKWNVVVLNRRTSHPYLHKIERLNERLFLAITSEMLDMKVKGYISLENLRRIHNLLRIFEEYYSKWHYYESPIKEEYKKRVLLPK